MKSMMFALPLVFLCMTSLASDDLRLKMTEAEAENVREFSGITKLAESELYTQYSFRDEGSFAISKTTFTTQKEAIEFCQSLPGFKLTSGLLHSVLTMMGLPFVELQSTALIKTPVLGEDGDKTGVASWIQIDLSQIPDPKTLSERDQKMLEFIVQGDFIMAELDGMGGEGSGPQQLSVVNSRMSSPLALHALCEDSKLQESLKY